MATPHVSGIAAMVMWKKGLTAAQTRTTLTSTAVDLGSAGRETCFGYGLANLANALREAIKGKGTKGANPHSTSL